jgi:hypothetical protein
MFLTSSGVLITIFPGAAAGGGRVADKVRGYTHTPLLVCNFGYGCGIGTFTLAWGAGGKVANEGCARQW